MRMVGGCKGKGVPGRGVLDLSRGPISKALRAPLRVSCVKDESDDNA